MEILSAISHRPHAKPKAVFKVLTASLLISTSILASPVSWASVASAASPSAGITYEQEFGSLEMSPAAPAYEISFSDVREGDWFYEDVMAMVDKGAINGMSDGLFHPNESLTASQAIKLAVAVRASIVGDVCPGNSDVGHWATNYFNYALQEGLLNNTSFSGAQSIEGIAADAPISRGETIHIFAAILRDQNQPPLHDITQSDQYYAGIDNDTAFLFNLGIIQGKGDGVGFALNDELTRAEVAAILHRVADPEARIRDEIYIADGYEFTDYQIEMCKLLNAERRAAGLNELRLDPDLCRAADKLAEEYAMGASGDHRLSGDVVDTVQEELGLHKSPRNKLRAMRPNSTCGSNRYTAEQASAAWMNSEIHRNNRMGDAGYYGVAKVEWESGKGYRTDKYGFAGSIFWVELLAGEEGKDLETLEVH